MALLSLVILPASAGAVDAFIVAGSPPNVIRVIDTSTNLDADAPLVLPSVATGPVALSPNGQFLYVLATDVVYRIDLRSRAFTTISLPATVYAIAASPDGRQLYGGTDAGIVAIDLEAGSVTSAFFGVFPPMRPLLAVASDGTIYFLESIAVYTCQLVALDPATLNAKWSVGLGGTACTGLAVSADGRYVYASAPSSNHSPWAIIHQVSTDARAIVKSLDLGVSGLGPGPLALGPNGKTLYSLNGNHDLLGKGSGVTVIDTGTLTVLKNVPITETDASPGIAVTPDGSFAYITNGAAGTVSVLDTRLLGPPLVLPQFGTAISTGGFVGPPLTSLAVEYYNASLDHYFLTSLPDEVAALDAGAFAGWARTGQSFDVYPSGTASGASVCRFYIPPDFGDSHFYSASASECAAVAARFPMLKLESAEAFRIDTADAVSGSCPPGDVAVYRLWNQRKDSNHRYTTSRSIRDAMVAKGYAAEGYGPDAVALCAP